MAGSVRGSELRWQRPDAGRARSLRSEYQRYLDRECHAFLRMLPRVGIRPLYAASRAWAADQGTHETKDPMASLVAYCRAHLPLPPFGVWLEDRRAHPGAHARVAAAQALSEHDRVPVKVATRRLEHDGNAWTASLHVFHEEGSWRGFIAFACGSGDGRPISVRTSNIFCETELNTLSEVFDGFTSRTLSGFLRSALP